MLVIQIQEVVELKKTDEYNLSNVCKFFVGKKTNDTINEHAEFQIFRFSDFQISNEICVILAAAVTVIDQEEAILA